MKNSVLLPPNIEEHRALVNAQADLLLRNWTAEDVARTLHYYHGLPYRPDTNVVPSHSLDEAMSLPVIERNSPNRNARGWKRLGPLVMSGSLLLSACGEPDVKAPEPQAIVADIVTHTNPLTGLEIGTSTYSLGGLRVTTGYPEHDSTQHVPVRPVVLTKKFNDTHEHDDQKITAEQTTSNNGIEHLILLEGFEPQVYGDVANYATIGIGFLIAEGQTEFCSDTQCVKIADGMTREQAIDILKTTMLPKFEQAVRDSAGDTKLTQAQFDGLVSFLYNVGPAGIDNSERMSTALRAGDIEQVASVLSEYVYAGGKPHWGLMVRREMEVALLTDGAYINHAEAEARLHSRGLFGPEDL